MSENNSNGNDFRDFQSGLDKDDITPNSVDAENKADDINENASEISDGNFSEYNAGNSYTEFGQSEKEDYTDPHKYKYNPYTGERNIDYGPYVSAQKEIKTEKKKKPKKSRKNALIAILCVLVVAFVSSSSILVYAAITGNNRDNEQGIVEPGINDNNSGQQSGDADKDNNGAGKLDINKDSSALENLLGEDATLSDVAQNTIKSVVGISNYKNVSNGIQGFFGGDGSSETTSKLYTEGSGVIITEDGYVITNQHVIDGSDALQVTMSTGEIYDAELVGEDEASDLALLKIKPDENVKFSPIVIGDSDELDVADYVMAVGNPGGSEFSSSVTFGIISGKDRPVTISSGYTINMLQTDAAINPGNSGGALVNMKGELIGISSAKYVAEYFENLGFAININDAMPIIEELAEYGYVKSRGTIDVDYQVIDRAMAQYYNLPTGLYVTKVNGDAGDLKRGDIITEVNGSQVYSEASLTNALAGKSEGDNITIKYYSSSNQKYAETQVTLVESKVQSSNGNSTGSQNGSDYYYGNDDFGSFYGNR